jgi:hypothetical protein
MCSQGCVEKLLSSAVVLLGRAGLFRLRRLPLLSHMCDDAARCFEFRIVPKLRLYDVYVLPPLQYDPSIGSPALHGRYGVFVLREQPHAPFVQLEYQAD